MNENAVARMPDRDEHHAVALTPMDMLNRAVVSGASMETLDKLMTLQERWEQAEARRAFNEAFAAAKPEILPVIRNKEITDGPLKGKSYADLFSFVQAVTPALSKHGLSHSWDVVRDDKDWIEIACIIEHVRGHSRRVKLGGPPDTGGAKNPLQARISTTTYLKKETLKSICGVAEQDDDDDGVGAGSDDGSDLIDAQQVEWLQTCIVDVGADIKGFLAYMAKLEKREIKELGDISVAHYPDAIKVLNMKKAKAAKERQS